MTSNFEKFLSPNRKITMPGAVLPNCIAKARVNLFLSGCECSAYVNKLIGLDLVNKILGRESSLVMSIAYQTNTVSRQYY